jgi:hypothetical protein
VVINNRKVERAHKVRKLKDGNDNDDEDGKIAPRELE